MPPSVSPAHRSSARSGPSAGLAPWSALRARLRGPGGYYNIGNVIGLCTGVGLEMLEIRGSASGRSLAAALRDHFLGSFGAVALTLAMVIFLASGEFYHRAWAGGFPPEARPNRAGDLLSALGAVTLSVALVCFGQTVLAAISGTLLAGGKLGSVLVRDEYAPRGPDRSPWPDRFRSAVLVSRLPAILAVVTELAVVLTNLDADTHVGALIAPLSLLVCYLLWTRADLLLFAAGERRE